MKYEFEEETKELPSQIPIKTHKNPLSGNQNSRLDAFRLMKHGIEKEPDIGITDCTQHIFNPIHMTISDKKPEERQQPKAKSLVDYYKTFVADQDVQFLDREVDNKVLHQDRPKFDVSTNLMYSLGFSLSSNSVVFHKNDKWIAYLQLNAVVVEDFNTRKQIFLNNTQSKLTGIKLSHNNATLISYANSPKPIAFFYDTRKEFKLLSSLKLKQFSISAVAMPSSGHLSVIAAKASEIETVILVYNFIHSEILATTAMNLPIFFVDFNIFLENLEFVTLSPKLFSFWRITKDGNLQYQHGTFEEDLQERSFLSSTFTPPLSFQGTVLLLVAVSDGDLWGIDTKTNSLLIKYSAFDFQINMIKCGLNNITIVSDRTLVLYPMPNIKTIDYDKLDIFQKESSKIVLDSQIRSFDIDTIESNEVHI